MTSHPYDHIPELAGIATYASAARIGWSVDETVGRQLRLHWFERRIMHAMVAHLPAEPIWELKCALALHQWQCAEHISAIRQRISEMRNPVPSLEQTPAEAEGIDAMCDELLESRTSSERITAYGVALPALAAAYRDFLDGANALADHQGCRVARAALADTEAAIAWGDRAIAVVGRSDAWRAHLVAHHEQHPDRPTARHTGAFTPDLHPRRDERFTESYNFDFPPHVVYSMPDASADERNLALLCKRTLEMDVPEMMASFMTERADMPWEFYHDYSRQLWDEARHAMMGSVALESRGIDWRREVPLNVSFALRLNLHADPVERQMMLYAIEQSLMAADTGKRMEHGTAVEAGDALSAHFHDFDWADEVLHAQIGRRALKREGIAPAAARLRAKEIHDRTWAALDQYRRPEAQRSWWPDFVRKALGHASVLETTPAPALNVFSE